jgi:hypothetical protein
MVSSMINADILPSSSKVNPLRIKLLYSIPDCNMKDLFLFFKWVSALKVFYNSALGNTGIDHAHTTSSTDVLLHSNMTSKTDRTHSQL